MVHCGHHKVGTVWFQRILSQVAKRCGRRFVQYDRERCVSGGDFVVYHHSRDFDPTHFHGRAIRGTHILRDPRDVAVSALPLPPVDQRTVAKVPRRQYQGRSYQEELRRLDPERGLGLEIEEMCTTRRTLHEMLAWDYQREGFLELRYEDLVGDEIGVFASVFQHYTRPDPESTERALKIVDDAGFRRIDGREIGQVRPGSRLRSGRPGEWREHFLPSHVERWNELAGRSCGSATKPTMGGACRAS